MKRMLIIIGIVVAAVLLLVGLGFANIYFQVGRYKNFWEKQARAKIPDNAFVYVALGDSAAQSIGASSPMKGYVGLIAKKIEEKTGRPVHIINLSKTSAKLKDAREEQVPKLKALELKPNLVTIDIGSNDTKLFDETRFAEELEALMKELPKATVIAELSPYFKDKAENANKRIHELAKEYDLRVAPLHQILKDNTSWRIYSTDYFHPSNYGYELWTRGYLEVIESSL